MKSLRDFADITIPGLLNYDIYEHPDGSFIMERRGYFLGAPFYLCYHEIGPHGPANHTFFTFASWLAFSTKHLSKE